MPGITGIISKHQTGHEEAQLGQMICCMMYESFYKQGKYIDHQNGFYIGYVVIENAFADCMPIFNETKDLVMFLTGETYMDTSLISDLKTRHYFNPNNAGYLIHLYEELGDDFFIKLNGWYNGLIIDNRKQKAILFNDRYGIRRIYYHESDDAYIFSSEAKSLLSTYPSLRCLDDQSIGEYLVYDCVLDNRTYFSNLIMVTLRKNNFSIPQPWKIKIL